MPEAVGERRFSGPAVGVNGNKKAPALTQDCLGDRRKVSLRRSWGIDKDPEKIGA